MSNYLYAGAIYKDRKGEWRWRLTSARNGKIVADCGEGYRRRIDCARIFNRLFVFGGHIALVQEKQR